MTGNDYRKCHCEVCKSHRGDTAHSRKYGLEHYEACLCDRCVRMYAEHNWQKTCACDDCASHRAYLYNRAHAKVINEARKPVVETGRKTKVATINMCERCGGMATSAAMGAVQCWDAPGKAWPDAVELCPGCVGEFHQFMNGETVSIGDRPKQGYRKPWKPAKSGLESVSTEDLAKALLSRQIEAGDSKE